jgi:tripartite-type tricarboxylate transporter receptor subunit TctC
MWRFILFKLLFLLSFVSNSQEFPARQVTLVLPYPISGPTDIRGTTPMTKTYKLITENAPPAISDILGRLVQRSIRYRSRFPVELARHPGGVTTRGAMHVARSPSDGHTLLLASNATMVLAPHYIRDVGFDPMKEFMPAAPLVDMPFVMMMRSGLPPNSLPQLIAYLKKRPGDVDYASSGEGSTGHLAGELFRLATGVDMVHVPYNGGFSALSGVVTGQVSLMFAAMPLALSYLNNEHLRVLALVGNARSSIAPDLPTLTELGVPNVEAVAWFGVFAPRSTPARAIRWLYENISEGLGDGNTRSQLRALGLEPVEGTLSRFEKRINSEAKRWGPVIRASSIV